MSGLGASICCAHDGCHKFISTFKIAQGFSCVEENFSVRMGGGISQIFPRVNQVDWNICNRINL